MCQSQKSARQYRQGNTVSYCVDRLRSRGAWQRLEPDEGKLSRPVLRGGSGGNVALLPDQWKLGIKDQCFELVPADGPKFHEAQAAQTVSCSVSTDMIT